MGKPRPRSRHLCRTSSHRTPPLLERASELLRNRHYQLLGLDGDRIAVRLAVGRILFRSRENLCSAATLAAIAPLHFWSDITGKENLGVIASRQLGDMLIRGADGIGPVDLSRIHGRGAVQVERGRIVWHLGDRLLEEGP